MDWFTDDPRRGQSALTLIAIVIAAVLVGVGRKRLLWAVSCAIIWLLLAATAIPSFLPARPVAFRNACVFNLRAIQDAKIQWARVNHKVATDTPSEVELYGSSGFLRHRPECPRGGVYTIGSVGQNPTCTFSNRGHLLP